MSRKQPQRAAGRAFRGWQLSFNYDNVGPLLLSPEAAKKRAQIASIYDLAWECRSTDPEGRSLYEGGHPLAVPGQPIHIFDTLRGIQEAEVASGVVRREIGEAAWRDRWRIQPAYKDLFEPVPGAIRAFSEARFFIAPDSKPFWSIWADGNTSAIERFHTKDTALAGARRLAAGVRTERQSRSLRNHFVVLFIFLALTLTFSIWLGPAD